MSQAPRTKRTTSLNFRLPKHGHGHPSNSPLTYSRYKLGRSMIDARDGNRIHSLSKHKLNPQLQSKGFQAKPPKIQFLCTYIRLSLALKFVNRWPNCL
jgi:hypothetical protein